jgi:AcrR family transcriptional regulator
VKEAILAAATDLFAARGPRAVSVRDIATRARVNHGLVHRHFGSKQAVLRAVLMGLVEEISAFAGPVDLSVGFQTRIAHVMGGSQRYWRVLARAILDGELPRRLQTDFPIIRQLAEAYRELARRGAIAGELDPKIAAAGTAALVMGWLLFEPFLLTAAALDDRTPEAARRELYAMMSTLLARMRQ